MPSPRETILAVLHARFAALPVTALRGEVLPKRIPAKGLLIPRGQITAPIFLLVPQVKLPKRLDLDRDAARALDSVRG